MYLKVHNTDFSEFETVMINIVKSSKDSIKMFSNSGDI